MKKISLVFCLALVLFALVYGSKSSKNIFEKQPVAEVITPEVKIHVAGEVPTQLRGYLLTDLPKALAEVVVPNDTVDVLATFSVKMKDAVQQNATVTLLQNIKVLAVGTSENKTYMVLALSPKDAQYLALTQREGDVSVVLRSPGDATQYIIEISTLEKLFQ